MRGTLAAELTVLATELLRIARADRRTRDFTLNTLRQALAEVAACLPVYRTYIAGRPSAQDRRYIDWAVARATRRSRAADITIFVVRAPGAARPGARRRGARARQEHAALRHALPAVHRAGRRQGRRGHRVLRLQPPRIAERGRRRSRHVRLRRERLPRRERRPRAALAAHHARHLDARQQALRGRAPAHQRHLRDARTLAAAAQALAHAEPPAAQDARGPSRAFAQ